MTHGGNSHLMNEKKFLSHPNRPHLGLWIVTVPLGSLTIVFWPYLMTSSPV